MELIFERAGEIVMVRIVGTNVFFSNEVLGFRNYVPFECLNLDMSGILKEFPDLNGRTSNEIKQEAIKRFKEHILKLGGEEKIKGYIIYELTSLGYSLKLIKQEGFRDVKV